MLLYIITYILIGAARYLRALRQLLHSPSAHPSLRLSVRPPASITFLVVESISASPTNDPDQNSRYMPLHTNILNKEDLATGAAHLTEVAIAKCEALSSRSVLLRAKVIQSVSPNCLQHFTISSSQRPHRPALDRRGRGSQAFCACQLASLQRLAM